MHHGNVSPELWETVDDGNGQVIATSSWHWRCLSVPKQESVVLQRADSELDCLDGGRTAVRQQVRWQFNVATVARELGGVVNRGSLHRPHKEILTIIEQWYKTTHTHTHTHTHTLIIIIIIYTAGYAPYMWITVKQWFVFVAILYQTLTNV